MNVRQQKYKKNRLKGMGITNAARAAGYAETYAQKKSYRLDRLAKVGLADEFERQGLTDKALVEFALKGLCADKVISANVISKDGEGMSDAHGTTKDFIEVPDWAVRHKYLETILKLTGKMNDINLVNNVITQINYVWQNEDGGNSVLSATVSDGDTQPPVEV